MNTIVLTAEDYPLTPKFKINASVYFYARDLSEVIEVMYECGSDEIHQIYLSDNVLLDLETDRTNTYDEAKHKIAMAAEIIGCKFKLIKV